MMQQLYAWIDAGNGDAIVISTVATALIIESVLKWRKGKAGGTGISGGPSEKYTQDKQTTPSQIPTSSLFPRRRGGAKIHGTKRM